MLQQWLDGARNYKQGVQLYLPHCTDVSIRKMLQYEGETAFKKTFLENAIKELVDKKPLATLEPVLAAPTIVAHTPKEWKEADCVDEIEKNLHQEARSLLKHIASNHAQLTVVATNEQRGILAFEILKMDDALSEIYAKADYYREHKQLPEVTKAMQLVVEPTAMLRRFHQLKRNITKYRRELKKGNPKAMGKLKKYVEEHNIYAEKLFTKAVAMPC